MDTKAIECIHWIQHGSCPYEHQCRYKHTSPVECRHWAHHGSCPYQSKCRYKHTLSVSPSSSRTTPKFQQLGIVPVSTKKCQVGGIVSSNVDDMVVRVTKMHKHLCLEVGVDVSGSMHGGPMAAIKELIPDLFHNVLRDNDFYGCFTFASKVRSLHRPTIKSKIALEKDLRNLVNNSGGCTALWDGIKHGMEAIRGSHQYRMGQKKNAKVQFMNSLMIITDGQDNSSQEATFEDCKRLISNPKVPNFQFVIVGLGDVDQARLQELCKGNSCHFLYAKDVSDFKRKLANARDVIRVRVDVSDGNRIVREQAFVHGSNMNQLISSFQNNLSLG
eukprot:m.30699 g.30699  ORF g.30699 m.30699 type:complete len:331 (+) comp6246_c0_seq1:405-1397(+)